MNINATLFGQLIAFIVFVWFCMRYVWPPIIIAIEERQQKIAEGLESAERADKTLKLAEANSFEQQKEAKQEAMNIIDQANKRKVQIVEEAREEALTEKEKILSQGHAEIEIQIQKVRSELQKEFADLAIFGAEKVIEQSVDKKIHNDLLESITNKL